ncbi:hypothetical protein [Dyella choica]|uniref:Uncharacterized protein n=1 Tax=Dyella choica TaxID=1927959 RepID=A0A3S0S9V5_9GAMM|nr:hypothetical protein [Dyella choica]RUL75278.1 hypothetical protein EKH80_11135 [Dyella choica]
MIFVRSATIFAGLCALFASDYAFAGWECRNKDSFEGGRRHVYGLGFGVADYQPRIQFDDQKYGDWSKLSSAHGVDTPRGMVMLAIALTAYSTQAQVRTRCGVFFNSSDGRNYYADIQGFTITDDGGIPDN